MQEAVPLFQSGRGGIGTWLALWLETSFRFDRNG